MGYIELSTEVPSTKKAVISLWFRVPGKTVEEIKAEYDEWREAEASGAENTKPRRFMGVIPLMTFGPTGLKSRKFWFPLRQTGIWPGDYNYRWSDGSGVDGGCVDAKWVITPRSEGGIQPGDPYTTHHWSFEKGNDTSSGAGGDAELNGSYIGVNCTADAGPVLDVNIVMPVKNLAKFAGAWPVEKTRKFSATIKWLGGSGGCPGAPVRYVTQEGDGSGMGPGELCYTTTYFPMHQDVHYEGNADVIAGCVPETFRLVPGADIGQTTVSASYEFNPPTVKPDHWHHALISFDFTNQVETKGQNVQVTINGVSYSRGEPESRTEGARTTSTCKMWVMLDDVNLTKEKLSAYWPHGSGSTTEDADNLVLPVNGHFVACYVNYPVNETHNSYEACQGVEWSAKSTYDLPKYNFTPDNVEFGTVGLPAHSYYVDAIRHCEMAELQIFTDVCYLDAIGDPGTVVEDAAKEFRRAFVTEEGKPAAPSKAEKLLGKKPEVIIRSAADWKKAKNIGTLAVPPPEGPKEGNFMGKILTYRPNPNLFDEDKQGEPQ